MAPLCRLPAAFCCSAPLPSRMNLLRSRSGPGGAPGSEGLALKESVENVGKQRTERRVTNVTNPTIALYLPPSDSATGTVVIVAPGGGHRQLSFDHEGHDVAKWLSSIGVAGVVLKYRLARAGGCAVQG
jgi:acetyl esterase/lipase